MGFGKFVGIIVIVVVAMYLCRFQVFFFSLP
jgi:hypothetical protein